MRKIAILAGMLVLGAAGSASAGAIESACMASNRGAANRALCGCIQSVANKTLTRSDQKTAARFFADPQRAQDMRRSSSRSNEAFWDRYKNFGATAQAYCSAG